MLFSSSFKTLCLLSFDSWILLYLSLGFLELITLDTLGVRTNLELYQCSHQFLEIRDSRTSPLSSSQTSQNIASKCPCFPPVWREELGVALFPLGQEYCTRMWMGKRWDKSDKFPTCFGTAFSFFFFLIKCFRYLLNWFLEFTERNFGELLWSINYCLFEVSIMKKKKIWSFQIYPLAYISICIFFFFA